MRTATCCPAASQCALMIPQVGQVWEEDRAANRKSGLLWVDRFSIASCALPAAAGAAVRLALLLEAIRAVDRLVAARHERHLGLSAASGAGCAVHLARAA